MSSKRKISSQTRTYPGRLSNPISLFRQFSLWQWSFQSGRTNSNANDINPSWLSEIYFWFSISYHIDHIKWKLLSKTQINLFMKALFSTIWLILTQKTQMSCYKLNLINIILSAMNILCVFSASFSLLLDK